MLALDIISCGLWRLSDGKKRHFFPTCTGQEADETGVFESATRQSEISRDAF